MHKMVHIANNDRLCCIFAYLLTRVWPKRCITWPSVSVIEIKILKKDEKLRSISKIDFLGKGHRFQQAEKNIFEAFQTILLKYLSLEWSHLVIELIPRIGGQIKRNLK